jgi:hypothetical protein
MRDEIVEVAEGDDGSDSLMSVVLLLAFLFVCYKAAEHFGWISTSKGTGVPSGTPATTSEAAGAVTVSVTGAVPGSGTAAVTGAVTGSGTVAVPGSGTSEPGTMPGSASVAVPGSGTREPGATQGSGSGAAESATVPGSASGAVQVRLLSVPDGDTLIDALKQNKRPALPQAPATVELGWDFDDAAGEDGLSTASNDWVFEDSIKVRGEQRSLLECVAVINTEQQVTFMLIYKHYADATSRVACFEQTSFDALCTRFPSVGKKSRSYVHVDANVVALQSFCRSKTSKTCTTVSLLPYETILHTATPRVIWHNGTYIVYVPTPAPQFTAARTSIAGAPTTATVQSPPAPPPVPAQQSVLLPVPNPPAPPPQTGPYVPPPQTGPSVLLPVPNPPAPPPQTGPSVLVPVPNPPAPPPQTGPSVLVPVTNPPALKPAPQPQTVPNPATMSVSSVHLMSDAETSALLGSLRGNARLILPAARAMQLLHDYDDDSYGPGLVSWTSGVRIYPETLRVDSSVFGILECLGVINTPALVAPTAVNVTYVLIYKNYFEKEQSKQYKSAWFEKEGFDKLCGRFPEVASLIRSYVHVAGDRQVLEAFCTKSSGACVRAGSVPTSILHASMPRVTKNGGAYRLFDPAQSNPPPQPTTAGTSIVAAPTPRAAITAPVMPVPVALVWPGAQTWNAMAEEPHRRVFFIRSTEETTRLKTAGLYSYAHDSAGVSTYVKHADVHDASSMQYEIKFKSSDQKSVEIRRNAGEASGIYGARFTFGTDGAISSGSSVIGQAYVRPTKTTTRDTASKRLIGESTILLRHSATSAEVQLLPVQVGTKTMNDVWSGRLAGSSASSALLYVTASGVPHVGGPPAPNGAMVCVYVLVSNKLSYVAYLDETTGKFRSYVGAETQYSVAPPSSPTPRATVLAPVTSPPARAAPTLAEWRSAPEYRKCFLVTAKTTGAKKLGGWYGWRIVGQSTAYQKAAYTLGSEVYAAVWLEVGKAGGQETVTIDGTTSVTCTLQGTRGETSDVKIECFLRPESQWASATKLNYVVKNNGLEFRDTLARVKLSYTYGIGDVWELDSYKGIYLAESGITHVGGPEMWTKGLIYTYNGASVTYLMYCTDAGPDKVRWFRFSDNARVDLSVRAA